MGTTRFLDQEVQRLQQQLVEREKALENFKRENMGSLPSQLNSNLSILNQLKEDLGRTEERVEQTRQQISMLNSQAQMQTQSLFAGPDLFASSGGPNSEVDELEKTLKRMRSRYTDQHPEVRAVKRRLEQVREEQQEEDAAEPVAIQDPGMFGQDMMQVQLDQMQMRLNNYKERMRELNSQIKTYEDRVERTSEVELELKNLQRDYDAVNDRFQGLLRRKLDAELGEQMERRQQGEQFRVVDPAIPPDRPFSPDSRRIMLMALVMGLGVGGGLGYLREVMDSALYTPDEVEQALNSEVVVSLPYVKKKQV